MDTNDSRQGCLPCPYDCIKTPAKPQKSSRRSSSSGPPARRDRLAAQRPHRPAAQETVQPLDQVGCHEVELLGPDGRRAGHDEDPLALARGLRLGGDDGPHGDLPDPLHLGQRGLRREPVGERRDRLADRSWLVAPHAASAGVRSSATAPGATRRRTTPAAPAPGHVREVRRGDHALPRGPDALDEALAALGVELAHDVVEEQHRRRAALLLERRAFGEQQRQQRQPLLALRPVDAQLAPVAQQEQLVAVRAVTGEAAVQVGVEPLRELGGELLGRLGLGARAIAKRRGAEEPELGGDRREACVEVSDRAGTVVPQRDAVARELEVPGRRGTRANRAPARSRASSALRWARAWE